MDDVSGFADLTFDDGTVFRGKASLFAISSARNDLAGNFRSDDCSNIAKQPGNPILSIGMTQYRVSLKPTRFPDMIGVTTIGRSNQRAFSIDF